MKSKIAVAVTFLIAIILGVGAQAEELQPGVARISLIHGDVSTQRGDSGDWVAGTLNAPVVAGDHISTGMSSKAEVQLDYANVLRLGTRTEVKIADLARTHIQVQVREGLVNYTSFKDSEAGVEIDTPNVAVRPYQESSCRIFVASDDETRVIVRKGTVDVTTPQGSTRIEKGDMVTIRGQDNPEYLTASAPRKDSWDEWNQERDHLIWDAEGWRHANRYYTGAQDLDAYGRWVDVPGYDQVWVPRVDVGWAPYRDGRWVWEPYYGWTWVSYEPWGWAPYHYGRWFVRGGSWCWWPGPVYRSYRPLWAPAYVSFFGFGRHFGVGAGFGFGSVGWLPIGPGDYYYPWWGAYRNRYNVVNITNINVNRFGHYGRFGPLGRGRPQYSNLLRVATDTRLRHGITTIDSREFGRGAVPRNPRQVSVSELRQGRMVAGNVPIQPTRASYHPSDRAVAPSTIRAGNGRPEHYFGPSRPTSALGGIRGRGARQPSSNHASGAQERSPAGWQRFGGERAALNAQSGAPNRTESPRRGRSSAQRPAQGTQPANRGWQRFSRPERPTGAGPAATAQGSHRGSTPARSGSPRSQAPDIRRGTPARPNAGGWQHFTPRSGASPDRQYRGTETRGMGSPQVDRGYNRGREQPMYRQQPRSMSSPGYRSAPRGASRPPLNLNRPIMVPRQSSGARGHSESRGSSRSSAPRESHSSRGRR